MKRLGGLLFALAFLVSPGALAGQAPKAVIELFTSQGCSSCPPADARLTALSKQPDVVALTLHVDYWDYLGWKDTLATPAFTARQRAYAEARGDRGVYTPQMVVNGLVACVGSNDGQIESSIDRATSRHARLPVPLAVEREGARVSVSIPDGARGAGELWLLRVDKSVTVTIERGENKGREATYTNVVREMKPIGRWNGGAARFEADLGGPGEDFVVLLHEQAAEGLGVIIGAAKGPGL